MTHYALIIDSNRCIGCRGCEVVCKNENAIALGEHWNKVVDVGPSGEYPNMELYYVPAMCQQCAEAPCTEVCPTGASYRDDENIVLINKEICIGCRYCMMACPYGVRSWNEAEHVVEKCTLCSHITKGTDELPMCVRVCATAARYFGDLDDPESDASKALAAAGEENVHTLADVGNHPSTHYILSPERAEWKEVI